MPKLPDLEKILADFKKNRDSTNLDKPRFLKEDATARLLKAFGEVHPAQTISLEDPHTIFVKNRDQQSKDIPTQSLPLLSMMTPYYEALTAYREPLDDVCKALKFDKRDKDGKQFFKKFPTDSVTEEDKAKLVKAIGIVFTDIVDKSRMLRFFIDADWGGFKDYKGIGRKFSRPTDWRDSALQKNGLYVSAASGGHANMIKALYHAKITLSDFTGVTAHVGATTGKLSTVAAGITRQTGGANLIIYGAPGTGKSFKLKDEIEDPEATFTVFHPDLQNSDFIGSLKPVMTTKGVSYDFAPGPFSKALRRAWQNPNDRIDLVIEELNRAPAAAIFGDLFLLLDRDVDGASEYFVDFASPEHEKWCRREIPSMGDGVSLPSNLWITATMNSADQGVYPLDTAFKRRWEQEYIKLDYSKAPIGILKIIQTGKKPIYIQWADFIRILNGFLARELSIQEDRLIGPWFVSQRELDNRQPVDVLPTKLMMYLWDDLLRHHEDKRIFDASILKTFGDIDQQITDKGQVFSNDFIKLLLVLTTTTVS